MNEKLLEPQILLLTQRVDKIEAIINHILRTIEKSPELVSIYNNIG